MHSVVSSRLQKMVLCQTTCCYHLLSYVNGADCLIC